MSGSEYTRNRIRHEVMPVLRGLNGQVEEALVRLGRTARWWSERVEGEAEATLESLTFEKGAGRLVLDARRLRELAEGEQAEVVRAALRRLGVGERRLGQRHVMAMLAVCEREGPVATEGPEGVRVRRSGGRLYFTRPGRS